MAWETLASDMVRAYLRKLQTTEGLAITGYFKSGDSWYIWGACGEYGDPPAGALVVELGHPNGKTANFRLWHARTKDDEAIYRGKTVMYDEPCQIQEKSQQRPS